MKAADSVPHFKGGEGMRLFDLHCDTLTECYDKGENLLENHRLSLIHISEPTRP